MDVDYIPCLRETIYIIPDGMVEYQVNQFRHTGVALSYDATGLGGGASATRPEWGWALVES
jgi:hypothetical protein